MGQVVEIRRKQTRSGKTTTGVTYGITSLTPGKAGPKELLGLQRGRWGIENGAFYVADMTFGEDACRVRSGAAPRVLAAIRSGIITMLNGLGWSNKAQAVRHYAAHCTEALDLLEGKT